jgi:chitodextrinase
LLFIVKGNVYKTAYWAFFKAELISGVIAQTDPLPSVTEGIS